MEKPHYSGFSDITSSLIAFSNVCREHKLSVGINHTEEAIKAAEFGFMHDRTHLHYGLRALFCTNEEECSLFDKLFSDFWGGKKAMISSRITSKNLSNMTKNTRGSLVMTGTGSDNEEKSGEAKNVSGASKLQALRKTDFSKVADIDSDLLDELAERLLRQMNNRLKRRLKTSRRGKIDLRKTIRKNISSGGSLIELLRKNKKLEKYRLNVLLDVSGSMDKYSYYLLKFIWSLKSNFKNIEAFVFSTKLIRITDYLHRNQLQQSLQLLTLYADNWSSGTKIGECLAEFNKAYAKRILNGKSITIFLSDGLDTGDPEMLAGEIRKIRLRTNKIIWLNPLKGMEGYEPLAKGMKAALPEIQVFESAHNLDSLLQLETILRNA